MFIKENLYFCWEDDRMTRDGGLYTKKQIHDADLTHLVIYGEGKEWYLGVKKGTDVHETQGGDFVVINQDGDIENINDVSHMTEDYAYLED